MSQSPLDDETDENGRYTFGLQDHIGFITNDIEEAVHDLEGHEIAQLCLALEAKIADVMRGIRQPQNPTSRRQKLESVIQCAGGIGDRPP